MRSTLSDILDLFFPGLCIVCEKRLVNKEKHICISCLNTLPRTGFHNVKDNKLEVLFAGRFSFNRIASFSYFVKGGSIQAIIHSLKYHNNPKVGYFIGQLCGKELLSSRFLKTIDCIVPVPLHPIREKERGYNQSLKIAEGLSSVVNIPICTDILLRKENNISQTKQGKFERWANMDEVFVVDKPEVFADKHILLLDDIITTGSTIESCAKAISKNNSQTIISVYSVGAVV